MSNKKPISWYAKRYVEKYGFHLVPIEPNRKFPRTDNWGNTTLSNPDKAAQFYDQNPDWNMGLALGPSRMCSLDIDCEDSFQMLLAEFGIDGEGLWKFPTIQGSLKGRRIEFAVPEGVSLPYCKLNWPAKTDPTGEIHRGLMRDAMEAKKAGNTELETSIREEAKIHARYCVIELRSACDGSQKQDVLPPSYHAEAGKSYEWLTQPPKPDAPWPTPPEWLLAIWTSWATFKPQLQQACPWLPVTEVKAKTKPAPQPRGEQPSVIDAFNEAHDLEQTLGNYGYKQVGRRWLSPHSGTGLPGVNILPDGQRCYIHHASDPLCSQESGQPVGAFDLFCYYDHGGDASKAVKDAAKLLGLDRKVTMVPTPMSVPPTIGQQGGEVFISQSNQDGTGKATKSTTWFKCLGYNNGKYYFLPRKTEQVVEMSASGLNKNAMLQMAPLGWWEMEYPGGKGCCWDAATDSLMRDCEMVGVYDVRKQRGRGAWYDNGKPVLHLGESLIVEGVRVSISEHKSEFIYTKQNRMENAFNADPANDDDARVVADIFKSLNWKKPEHAMLALGWCILAPVCGALKWRPHVWITGGRGEGKSWAQSYIIKPIVGEGTIVYCQGGSTEAGIRQMLKSDARPVMFDEAESEDSSAARRMQSVLELARQASSDTGAEIVKGTAGGDGMSFNVRSMFMMGSINVALKQAADESRFSVVSLTAPSKSKEQAEWFSGFERHVMKTLSDDFCSSIRARTYHMIPTIRHNALLLAQAVAEVLGSQRMGDQVGSLLAGAFSVTHGSNKYTLEECRDLVKDMDFSDAEQSRDESDELSCINEIMQHTIRVEKPAGGSVDRSIGELIGISHTGYSEDGVCASEARSALLRVGIRVEMDRVWIANKHRSLSSILRDTPWGSGHMRMLMRINGAESGGKVAKFAGAPSKFVSIPISSIQ